jgi:uncharacterized protein (DUF58 family)
MNFIKLKPDMRLLQLCAALTVLGLISSIWPEFEVYWKILLFISITLSLVDMWLVYKTPVPVITRNLSSSLSVGVSHDIKLTVKNVSRMNISVDVYDHFPEQSIVKGMPRRLLLDANEVAELIYHLKPLRRGLLRFTQTECSVLSRFSLWRYKHLLPVVNEVRVYPNYAPVIEYALLATENHLSMMGILKHRRRGQGMEFHQLREFRDGDSIKQIDWKASSRMRKIISREYQDERDQQIIIMLDCGHRMLAQDGDLSHFDHSLNALLLLSYVSLRQGDSIGVSTFSHENARWVKPVKGVANLHTLLNSIYDLQPGADAPDYSFGARNLVLRQRKRSLVIIMTNLRDDDSDDLNAAVQLLKKYHKVVVASLQEQAILNRLDSPVLNHQDALSVAATHGYQAKRDLLVQQLRNNGINTLDVSPQDLALSLTNTYLDLKTSGQI